MAKPRQEGSAAPKAPAAPPWPAQSSMPAAFARRDPASFEMLVGAYYPLVFRVAARMLGDRAEAEDVAQEVFLKLWAEPERVLAVDSLKPWLARVAGNAAIDRRRRRAPEPMAELPEVPAGEASPEQHLLAGDAARQVEIALQALPDNQRLALVLTYYEGCSNREAAEALGVGVEAVESLLARARRGLKSALAGQWREIVGELERI